MRIGIPGHGRQMQAGVHGNQTTGRQRIHSHIEDEVKGDGRSAVSKQIIAVALKDDVGSLSETPDSDKRRRK